MSVLESKYLLLQINNLIKKMDELYKNLATHYNLTDSALWIIYTIRLSEKALTQKELSSMLCMSKQTINSSLKKMIDSGLITLTSEQTNKKNKVIGLSKKGIDLAKNTADIIINAELETIETLSREKIMEFITLFNEYKEETKQQFSKL